MNEVPINLNTWILAGQSNMEGYGFLRDVLPPDPRVWNFTSAGHWAIAEEPLVRPWESYTPVNQELLRARQPEADRALSNGEIARRDAATRDRGAGLGMAFGAWLAEATQRPVGLISCGQGATSLEQWSARLKDKGAHSLYGAMLDRVRRAGGHLRGLLWYQGESDAVPELAATYGARLRDWIEAARRDLSRPDLPILIVQLGRLAMSARAGRDQDWDNVREAQRRIAEEVPGTAVTSAIDLGLSDDCHIDTPELKRLGRRLARLADGVVQHGTPSRGPRVERIETPVPINRGMLELRVVCSFVSGGWTPPRHISGFAVRNADGGPTDDFYLTEAFRDPFDSTAIRLRLRPETGASLSQLRIGYGLGRDPYCNARDEADLPLTTFTPLSPTTQTAADGGVHQPHE